MSVTPEQIAELRAKIERLTRERDEARSENDHLSDQLEESRHQPWPEWAEQCLKIVRRYSGYDGYDDAEGVDLPEELEECLNEFEAQADAKTIMFRANAQADQHKRAAEHYRLQANDLRARTEAAEAENTCKRCGKRFCI